MGNPQGIECIVNTVSGVDFSSVMINWIGPNGNLTTDNNSRIIVNPITSIGNKYVSDFHFIYLMEEDEGIYTCIVTILGITKTSYVELKDLSCMLGYVYVCTVVIMKVYT